MLLSFVLAPPLPDGTIDQGDRQHIAWTYSGILAAASVVFLTPVSRILAVDQDVRILAVKEDVRILAVDEDARFVAVR